MPCASSSSVVVRALYGETLSCMNKCPSYMRSQPSIIGTIRLQYVSKVIVRQSFSQKMSGARPALPEKQPHTIQLEPFENFGITQSRSISSPGRRVIQTLLPVSVYIALSSVHSIRLHSYLPQFSRSSHQSNRRWWFARVRYGFTRATRRA